MPRKKYINIEIDKLTNSIKNAITEEVFETEFSGVNQKEIKKEDWLFDWKKEIKDKSNLVYKMTTVENKNIIQGLVSLQKKDDFVFISLVESANFNRGKDKIYEGVGGNLFAFACKVSKDFGFGGFVSFISKSSLFEYYNRTLGATRAIGQRMVIVDREAEILISKYFKISEMKRKQSNEPDLYVVNKKLTDEEVKEISDFIQSYKEKKALKKNKRAKVD